MKRALPSKLSNLVNQWVEEMPIDKNEFLAVELQKEKKIGEISDTLTLFIERVQNGVDILKHNLTQLSATDPQEFAKNALLELEEMEHVPLSEDQLIQSDSTELISLKDRYGISDEAMKTYQSIGNNLYKEKRFDEASDVFFFLCNLDSYQSIYWLTLGNIEYFKGEYQKAIYAYSAAFLDNLADPRPHLYSASCFKELGEIDKAKEMLECALDVVRDNHELIPEWEHGLLTFQSHLNKLKR